MTGVQTCALPIFQVFGLGGGKSFHIDCKRRVLLCRPLRLTQLAAHIPGQVFISSCLLYTSQILCPVLLHLLMDQFQFFCGHPKQNRHIPLALCHGYRSGSRFFGAADLWAGSSCLSLSRTEGRDGSSFFLWVRLRCCSSRTRSIKPSSTAGWLFKA